jgi:hypothetical protein
MAIVHRVVDEAPVESDPTASQTKDGALSSSERHDGGFSAEGEALNPLSGVRLDFDREWSGPDDHPVMPERSDSLSRKIAEPECRLGPGSRDQNRTVFDLLRFVSRIRGHQGDPDRMIADLGDPQLDVSTCEPDRRRTHPRLSNQKERAR